jgi:Tol biopolymer transport system component
MITQRLLWLCLAVAAAKAALADPLTIERVNVNPDTAAQADGPSDSPSLSADGGVVAFVSQSSTLADPSFGLTVNSPAQIYAFDRNKGALELISVSVDAVPVASDGPCRSPQVSADGLFVAFVCSASNLPKSLTGASSNTIYIRDRAGGTTFVPMYDWPTVAQAFSGAANPEYLRRYMSGDIGRISFESSGALFPSLVYVNKSNNASAVTIMCGPSACTGSQISTDGNRIAFATGVAFDGGDANAHADVYVYDVDLDTYTLVSLNDDKSQGNGDVASGDVALSGDGALIAFSSGLADNFAGSGTANALVLRNIDAGTLTAVSVNDGGGTVLPVLTPRPALSDEGTIVAFTSNNTALAPHPNKPPADALVRNMKADLLRSMCRSRSGNYGNNTCFDATVSADGLWGAFTATANNLVADDTNNQQDVFVVSLDVLFDDIFADGMEH